MQFYQLPAIFNILFTVALIFFTNASFAKGLNSDELKALINDKTVESESARGLAAITYSRDRCHRTLACRLTIQ